MHNVHWPSNFKPGKIERYDGTTNPDEFLQVYNTAIEAAGGDEKVMANYLHTRLSGAARSWLTSLKAGSIRSWDHLCHVFIGNFQGTYVGPGVPDDLFRTSQKTGETLREFICCFSSIRNMIPEVTDVEVI